MSLRPAPQLGRAVPQGHNLLDNPQPEIVNGDRINAGLKSAPQGSSAQRRTKLVLAIG